MRPITRDTVRLVQSPRLTLLRGIVASLWLILTTACGLAMPTFEPTPTSIALAQELVFYDWAEDMPQSVLAAFTAEYGVRVKYLVYESQEEAIDRIRAGEVYDVVVMESRFIPLMAGESLLANLELKNLPNLKNVSANFRELAYDPNNQHSIPYNWGTTGLVVRSDLVDATTLRWSDLWDPEYAGKVGLWMGAPREVLGLALKSLGYSVNSEDPAELEQALGRLLQLKPHALPLEYYDLYTSAKLLADGQVCMAMGYASDVITGQELNPAIQYALPAEGALLWNDTFVIPANSPHQYTAEVFLNFLMRPDINAMITNENLYATTNEAALEFILPEILNNPVIFPSNADLANAELILPLSPAGQQLHDEIWKLFLAAPK